MHYLRFWAPVVVFIQPVRIMPIRQSASMVHLKACFWHLDACYDVIPFIRVALIRFPNLPITKRCESLLQESG